jgi:transposase-like protein
MSIMETMGRTQRPRRSFTKEFKAEVVELVRQPGNTAASVARDLDLTETAVREWVKQADLAWYMARSASTSSDWAVESPVATATPMLAPMTTVPDLS